MEEEKLKQAFSKIKEDIFNLGNEISEIRTALLETNSLMKQINEEMIQIKLQKIAESDERNTEKHEKISENHLKETPTHNIKTPIHPMTPTDNPTHPQEIRGLKSPNLDIPIGNEGVPTDRQTDQQTIRQILRQIISQEIKEKEVPKPPQTTKKQEDVVHKESLEKPIVQQITEASEILDSLDAIKKEIRRKFKRITKQEMLVFSTIYQLEEQDNRREGTDYKKIALKLGLSQSSIRDYTQKLIDKGIPITKEKLNNKKIMLHISPELKKIATLNTIIQLREI